MSTLDAKAFRTLGRSYGLFRDVETVCSDQKIELSLKPISWISVSLKVLLLSLMWAYFIYFCWQLDPGPIAYVPCTILGLLVAGWPLYIPIIRRFLVKSPILVVDTASKLIHVARLRKDFKLDDLYAVCDVVGPDGDGLKCRRELQLVLQMSGGFEFVLVSKSIRDIFGPIAKELASFAETRHLSVDILAGTVIESSTVWTDDRSTNKPLQPSGGATES
jgi:hypothetical protein